ncbi:MAG: hypothetical protein IT326_02535 [Anaerolineae bacterium]|nr:hypothetical protein [Anaerolineae bacterium]
MLPPANLPGHSPDPPRRLLSVTDYFLLGGTPPILRSFMERDHQVRGIYAMDACNKVIADGQKQLLDYFRYAHRWPETLSVYRFAEHADHVRSFPVQLATLLVEAILLTTGEDCPEDGKLCAINGIALDIVQRSDPYSGLPLGARLVTASIISAIAANAPHFTRKDYAEARLRASLLFLQEVARPDQSQKPRTVAGY